MLTIEFEYMVVNDCFVGVVPCRAPALGNFGYLGSTITHNMITEPNLIIFELFSVIPAL